jgi:hypothetical protein
MAPRPARTELDQMRLRIRGRWPAEDMAILLHDCSSLYNIRLALSFEPRLLRYGYGFGPWGPEPWQEWLRESPGAPLEVRRIEYASPGFIDLRGVGDAIEQLRILVERLILCVKQTRREAKLANDQREVDIQAQRLAIARDFLGVTREARDLGLDESAVMDYFVHQIDGAQERMLRQIERRSITGVKRVSDSKGEKGRG